jgi:hypothetical protein
MTKNKTKKKKPKRKQKETRAEANGMEKSEVVEACGNCGGNLMSGCYECCRDFELGDVVYCGVEHYCEDCGEEMEE